MVDGRLVLVVLVVYARWNTYVSDNDNDDLELYEQCFELLIVCNASKMLWSDSLWCVMLCEQCLTLQSTVYLLFLSEWVT